MTTDVAPFEGFPSQTFTFFRELEANNTKTWFEANRPDYQTYLLSPLIRLATALGPTMAALDPALETRPVSGKTISKIHRDIRFSADKSPFRTSMWLTYKRPRRDWMAAPAFFFEIAADRHRYGMGFYSATRGTMDTLREKLNAHPRGFRQAIAPFWEKGIFVVEGETYKRKLPDCKFEEFAAFYHRKNMYMVRNEATNDALGSHPLLDTLVSRFTLLAPLYNFLVESENTPT
jgi:uncharacterized protein (TIGR02453 family)